MFQNTKLPMFNAGNYIIETRKNIILGKAEKIITEDINYKEKTKEKWNKDDGS